MKSQKIILFGLLLCLLLPTGLIWGQGKIMQMIDWDMQQLYFEVP